MNDVFMNRELSWLKFNERVLEEAEDENTPLCERLSFVSIYQSNLDEFFMVRVGSLVDQDDVSPKMRENKTHMTAKEQIDAVIARVHELNGRRDAVYARLMEKLEEQGVRLVDFRKIGRQESERLERYFDSEIAPLISFSARRSWTAATRSHSCATRISTPWSCWKGRRASTSWASFRAARAFFRA